ncbi:MAG: WD40 repeat domain-containing serine/threonine-protein kinase [Planctomycetales bacterium]
MSSVTPPAPDATAPQPPLSPSGTMAETVISATRSEADVPKHIRYFGDYELLGELARGGMGVVYRARQVSLNRIVALKMILAGRMASNEEVRRFRQEAEAAANLDHPHIVPIYEIGEHEGQHYFSMKLIPGRSLREVLANNPAGLTPATAARIVVQVARGVHHAHQRGLLHRDLKPGNILLDHEGVPHVTDFGLVRAVDRGSDLTETGAILGTPGYMSPEQARGSRSIATNSDVYSLGAVLYELLTGRAPFRGGTPAESLHLLLSQEPAGPRSLRPGLDADLETICLKCLEKEPDRRYESAAALAEDLDRWSAGLPILARRSGPGERLLKWVRRRPLAAALTASSALATLALIAAGVGFYVNAQLRQSNDRLTGLNSQIEQARQAESDQRSRAELALEQLQQESERVLRLEAQQREQAQRAQEVEKQQRVQAVAALGEAERSLYFQRILLAERHWRADQVARAELQLDACPPHLRQWEWHYLKRQCRGEDWAFRGYAGAIRDIATTPAGLSVVTAEGLLGQKPPVVSVWNIASPPEGVFISGHVLPIITAAISPTGRYVASSAGVPERVWHSEVRVWDRETETCVLDVPRCEQVALCLAFSPDETQLALGGQDGTVQIWDFPAGERQHALGGHSRPMLAVRYSADGKQLASACEAGTILIHNPQTGEQLRALQVSRGWAFSVDFSPDGLRLAAAGGLWDDKPGQAQVWDLATGNELMHLRGHTRRVRQAAFSPDGRQLATAGADPAVKLWNLETGEELFTIHGHTQEVYALKFQPDGRQLLTVGEALKAWDLRKGSDVQILAGLSSFVVGLGELSDERRLVAVDYDGRGRIWDLASGESTAAWQVVSPLVCAAFSPVGDRLAIGSQSGNKPIELKLLESVTGQELFSLAGSSGGVRSLAFSPDGSQVAGADQNGRVHVWDASSGAKVAELPVDPRPGCVAFSPDGRRIAAGCAATADSNNGGTVVVVSIDGAGEPLRYRQHTRYVSAVAFDSAGGRIASVDWDGNVGIWNSSTGETIATWHDVQHVRSIAFSPDGQRLATAKMAAVTLWDPTSGLEILTFRGRMNQHQSELHFSRDGQRLFAGSGDGAIKIWDTTPSAPRFELEGKPSE